jgi:hypothetical protein
MRAHTQWRRLISRSVVEVLAGGQQLYKHVCNEERKVKWGTLCIAHILPRPL